jgi:hypothetical protein
MMIGKNAAAALASAALGLALLCQPGPTMADEVTVAKNGTRLTLAPANDSPTQWKLNSGFPLTVMEQRGDWLRVQAAGLPREGGDLWVRADQVTPAGGGGEGATSTATDALEQPIGYRVELTGTPGMKFKLECRSFHDGQISFRPHYNKLPQSYEYSADPLACVVWKKQHYGELQISLVEILPTKERVIGSAATQDDPASLFARSRGPGYPTSLFAHSDTPWDKGAVVPATNDDMELPPSASATP